MTGHHARIQIDPRLFPPGLVKQAVERVKQPSGLMNLRCSQDGMELLVNVKPPVEMVEAISRFKVALTQMLLEMPRKSPRKRESGLPDHGISLAIKMRSRRMIVSLDADTHSWADFIEIVSEIWSTAETCYVDTLSPIDRYIVVAEVDQSGFPQVVSRALGSIGAGRGLRRVER